VVMTGLTGEAGGTLRLNFGRPLLLQFRRPAITADTGLPISVLLHHGRTPSRLVFTMGALGPGARRLSALAQARSNLWKPVKLLGISRPTLYDLIQQHRIGLDM
jgi:hypothetical protein